MDRSTVNRILKLLTWPAALFIAYILLWYEQYKLTANPGSTYLFAILTDWLGFPGDEKIMRLGVGGAEIITSILVLIPATRGLGGLGAVALMGGAMFFHLVSPLGIDPYQDGAVLFTEACESFACGVFIVLVYREELLALGRRLVPARLHGAA